MSNPAFLSNLVLASLLCAGCSQGNSVEAEPTVREFFVDIVIGTNEAGDYALDEDGNFDAECRLGSRIVTENGLQHPILETNAIRTASYGYSVDVSNVCHFEHTLPHGFCAMTSVQGDLDCKISRGRGPGWFVEARFSKPDSAYMQCTMACFDFAAN